MVQDFKSQGFSLIELLIVIFIFGVIASMSVSAYKQTQGQQQAQLAANTLASSFRRAQIQAQAVSGDSQWGVKIQDKSIIVFKGNSYASRAAASDELITLPASVYFSGLEEVVFTKMFGLPQTTGTTTITGFAGQPFNVVINSKGTVSY